MRRFRIPALLGVVLSIFWLAACTRASASWISSNPDINPTQGITITPTVTEPVAAALLPSPAASRTPISEDGPAPVASASPTFEPVASVIPPASCSLDLCFSSTAFRFQRPIAAPGVDNIETAYRFGSTQGGQRDPHHGVEFLNPKGWPVLAAGDGEVVVVGDDRKIFYRLYSYFYGNLVIIRHADFTAPDAISYPLYSLYGHLSEIEVEVGDHVTVGQEIGKVGMTGVATGTHLHFEVRLGDTNYASSRNPELWLAPHANDDDIQNGALAGRIIDKDGSYVQIESIVIRHLVAPGQGSDWELYLRTYEEKDLIGQPPWKESFAAGDIPPGWYEISFVKYGMQRKTVQVLPGQLTVLTIDLGQSE